MNEPTIEGVNDAIGTISKSMLGDMIKDAIVNDRIPTAVAMDFYLSNENAWAWRQLFEGSVTSAGAQSKSPSPDTGGSGR